MKISLSQTEVHDKKDFIAKFYVTKSKNPNFNALLVECITGHYKTKLKNATRIYFIIEGHGTFTINGLTEKAEMHDCFIITANEIYSYEGKMKLIEVNVPATDKENEELV